MCNEDGELLAFSLQLSAFDLTRAPERRKIPPCQLGSSQRVQGFCAACHVVTCPAIASGRRRKLYGACRVAAWRKLYVVLRELCENALAFEGVLVLSAVCEALQFAEIPDELLIERVEHLQKRLKYGLNSSTAIVLNEMGFADRIVAAEIATLLGVNSEKKKEIRKTLLARREDVGALLQSFPSYYLFVWESIMGDMNGK
jgi:hypothetical protein